MMDEDEAAVVALVDDDCAAEILRLTSVEPMSVTRLTERTGASEPTVYRRLQRLREHDLVVERQRIDPDGHHHSVYTARLERVTVELAEGHFEVEVVRADDPADQFTRLVDELR